MTLHDSKVATRLPAQDLDRARAFYADVLGLEPADERPGGLLYRPAHGGEFALFLSAGRASGEHTQMGFEVEDIEATVAALRARGVELETVDAPVAALRARGVELETVDAPGLSTRDGIADIDGNYPSTGARGERGAWFRDSEGNLLGVGQPVR
jgi:catechol 2,3-dioxygenase-like lactoylglutathione lyase family enzyme